MSNTKNRIIWILTILVAMMFIGAGFAKVLASEEMVQAFALFGLPSWFRVAIGSIEIVGGILLLVPSMTGSAAFGLITIMIGAISCHIMFTPLSEGIPALLTLGILIFISLTRKNVIPVYLQKYLV